VAKGLLISYGGYPYALSSFFPDNGLASLAAVLRAEGHEAEILDYNTAETASRIVDAKSSEALTSLLPYVAEGRGADCADALVAIAEVLEANGKGAAHDVALQLATRCAREQIDFVGFKLWSGDGFEASVHMADVIRAACPRVKLFAGGPAVHWCGDVVLAEAPVFDAVVHGDGEPAIVELARFAEGDRSLDGIPNLLASNGGDMREPVYADLAALPLPEYGRDVYPALWNGSKIKLMCLDESRGCPVRCAFCINWHIEGTSWRTRRPAAIVEEMTKLRAELKTRAFRMAGTYSDPRLVRAVCEAIIADELEIEFGLFLNAGGVTEELVALLKAAGCFGVFFGVESGSDAILKEAMHKPLSTERVRRALKATRDAGLFTAGSFIFPAPFETAETEQETKRLIEEVFVGHAGTSVLISPPGLMPRTQWWQERSRFGFELELDEVSYRKHLLRYKIRHILPASLWASLPYRLGGRPSLELARRAADLQAWARGVGLCVNLPDHDAQVGAAVGLAPRELQGEVQRALFAGATDRLQDIVDAANEGFSP
jgi:hypothetical protein